MTNELRIGAELFTLALHTAREAPDALAAIRVQRYCDGNGHVEFLARSLCEGDGAAARDCVALVLATSAIDGFAHRLASLTHFAGCIVLGAGGFDGNAVGFVSVAGGVDWLHDLVVLNRCGGADSVVRHRLNRLGEQDDRTMRHMLVVGAGALAGPLAGALFSAELSTRPEAVASRCAQGYLAGCDVVMACLGDDEQDALASLRVLCSNRVRALVEVRGVKTFAGGGSNETPSPAG